MSPVLILVVGVVVVIGLIIVLRVNAFIALITAAMIVSLLAPGEFSDKISRVAVAFGETVGKIGIVIALAAVIGKCLMDSGAADRIVRAFLKTLGEKNASMSLMASGFVLSIPVFFDTVFYLLVPLARSLHKRTQKNYMLYLMAICAGGCITHTLVPPTPGPLLIAAEFNIDLGLMMLMGAIVAFPTAVVALGVCKLINRWVNIPMRDYGGEPEPEPLTDAQLPPLWLSLLPVVLPVILISANSIAGVLAKTETINLLTPRLVSTQVITDVNEAKRLASDLVNAKALTQTDDVAALAKLLEKERVVVPEAAQPLAQQLVSAKALSFAETTPRPAQNTANVTAVLGSPNLALLFSAIIAMAVLVWKRKIPLRKLAESVDSALMSGGVIILITAGGGAFGAMLRAANIEDIIQPGNHVGIMIFLTAFASASILKFAQGSSTVAMTTTAGIFAAMGITTEMLGCHHVYLALTIGAGSLFGSWMNDSGFWIMARMGVLTEAETLKSWTPCWPHSAPCRLDLRCCCHGWCRWCRNSYQLSAVSTRNEKSRSIPLRLILLSIN
jgi:GntP family gluconate:H+ symporter